MNAIRSKLTTNGRVTVPKKVREHLNIGPSSWVDFDIDANGDVSLRKSQQSAKLAATESRFAALRGIHEYWHEYGRNHEIAA